MVGRTARTGLAVGVGVVAAELGAGLEASRGRPDASARAFGPTSQGGSRRVVVWTLVVLTVVVELGVAAVVSCGSEMWARFLGVGRPVGRALELLGFVAGSALVAGAWPPGSAQETAQVAAGLRGCLAGCLVVRVAVVVLGVAPGLALDFEIQDPPSEFADFRLPSFFFLSYRLTSYDVVSRMQPVVEALLRRLSQETKVPK